MLCAKKNLWSLWSFAFTVASKQLHSNGCGISVIYVMKKHHLTPGMKKQTNLTLLKKGGIAEKLWMQCVILSCEISLDCWNF